MEGLGVPQTPMGAREAEQKNPLALAFVGDTVWDLLVRQRLLTTSARVNALHRQAQGHETAARDLFRQAVPDVRGTFGPTQMESILKTRIAAMRGPQTEQKAFPVLHLLHSLHAAAPAGTELRLDRITLDARHCTISGTARSYGEVARTLHSAPRAIGQACGANPYPLVVPCHRVIAAGGGLGGFARNGGGFLLEVKRWLLAHEGVSLGG